MQPLISETNLEYQTNLTALRLLILVLSTCDRQRNNAQESRVNRLLLHQASFLQRT